jgi:hypothetical protein
MAEEDKRGANGHFGPGNPGRPKGAKNKLQEAFWTDFAEAWAEGGKAALKKVSDDDPATFVRVAASVMPKDLNLDLDTRFVMRAPAPYATAAEWERDCAPKAGNGSAR